MVNFFNVLHGNKSGTNGGRVLESTKDDDVFIFYTDHGAPGFVTFPFGPVMHASELNAGLNTMHSLGMYGKLLVYMDACNCGSMFAGGLLAAPNAFAVAAASPTEESFAGA
jgi:legumain